MIIYILSYCALAAAAIGLIVSIVSLVKILFNKTQSITDVNCEYLTSDAEEVKNISVKYSSRVRGSVRINQGRIKSVSEIKMRENTIHFP